MDRNLIREMRRVMYDCRRRALYADEATAAELRKVADDIEADLGADRGRKGVEKPST